MNSQMTRDFIKTMKLLYDNDCASHVMVIGSWAEYLYAEAGVLPGFQANLRTLDVDVLVKNLRKPKYAMDLQTLARDEGYLIETDRLTGVTKWMLPGSLEVEFLLSKRGAGHEAAMKTNIGVTAQTLRHLDILTANEMEVEYYSMTLTVPRPEAYVLHKMIIQKERLRKSEKDLAAIQSLLPHLDMLLYSQFRSGLTKTEQREVQRCEEMLGLMTP